MAETTVDVSLAIVGDMGSGKTSLANAIMGDPAPGTDFIQSILK